MVTAALVAGNAVCFKPAEQTPAIAAAPGARRWRPAACPPGVLSLPPRRGRGGRRPPGRAPRRRGHRLHRLPAGRPVDPPGRGCRRPGQRQIKRVITELGGKNPIIVDADADPDEAVPGHRRQRVRLRRPEVLGRVAPDRPPRRLRADRRSGWSAHTELMELGHPQDPGVIIGPVIDADAHERLLQAQRRRRRPVPGPRRARDEVPDGRLVRRADDRRRGRPRRPAGHRRALRPRPRRRPGRLHRRRLRHGQRHRLRAHGRPLQPLTGRRSPGPAGELRAGNIYLNRGTTGAVVGRQPFGGFGLSGIGSKAGGPDYLLQFCDPVVVTENTLRQGFAADQLTA